MKHYWQSEPIRYFKHQKIPETKEDLLNLINQQAPQEHLRVDSPIRLSTKGFGVVLSLLADEIFDCGPATTPVKMVSLLYVVATKKTMLSKTIQFYNQIYYSTSYFIKGC